MDVAIEVRLLVPDCISDMDRQDGRERSGLELAAQLALRDKGPFSLA